MGDVTMALAYVHPSAAVTAVYHVVVSPPYVAACNSSVMLDSDTERRLSSITPGFRCQRRACRNRWEADDAR